MKPIFASLLCVAAACAHDPLGPGGGNNAGTGTNTILVTGTASASSDAPNANVDTSFSTDLQVDLRINNVAVTTGTVTITGRSGTATLVHQGGGQWGGTIANYDPVYELNVTSGPDNVQGVFVEGPDIHTFSAPLLGATVDATMTITTTWIRAAAAQQAVFHAGQLDVTIADSGTYLIPARSLNCDPQQSTQDHLRLVRSNSIVPKGAVAGSSFTVGVSQTIDVVALAAPGC